MTTPLPYRSHDHDACITRAMDDAHRICEAQGVRLTRLREQVLSLIWQSHRALGAYDILDSLNAAGRKSAPPTVYRTLDFLQQMGFVHRISSLNAFIGCNQPDCRHTGCFLICNQCRNVLEIEASDIQDAIGGESHKHGFQASEAVVEIKGLCPGCQDQTTP